MNEIEVGYVKPFYLKMMGLNAVRNADRLWPELVAAGRAVTSDDVSWMLRCGAWRPGVMGGWLALAMPAEEVRADLLAAMRSSGGSLTASTFATVSLLIAGADAIPAMTEYVQRQSSADRRDGSERFVAAALDRLGASPVTAPAWDRHSRLALAVVERSGYEQAVTPGPADIDNLAAMLNIATRLRDAFTAGQQPAVDPGPALPLGRPPRLAAANGSTGPLALRCDHSDCTASTSEVECSRLFLLPRRRRQHPEGRGPLLLAADDRLPDETWVYPGHGTDTTLGAERPHLEEWRERGW